MYVYICVYIYIYIYICLFPYLSLGMCRQSSFHCTVCTHTYIHTYIQMHKKYAPRTPIPYSWHVQAVKFPLNGMHTYIHTYKHTYKCTKTTHQRLQLLSLGMCRKSKFSRLWKSNFFRICLAGAVLTCLRAGMFMEVDFCVVTHTWSYRAMHTECGFS